MLNQFNVSIWGDEAFSAVLSQKSIPDIISTITHDTSPPLFNILQHLWFSFFGHSEVAIRVLSFLFFLLAVFFVYKIGESLWERSTGLIAALLVFLNPFFFNYAFEGRMYSLLALTVTASFYFMITKKWIPYVIATTLALYTHHFAIFAIFVQGIWLLKEFASTIGKKGKRANENRHNVISHFLSFLAIGVLYIPWLIPLYNQTKMVSSGFWLGKPTIADFLGLSARYVATGIDNPLAKPALVIALILLVLRQWHKNIQKSAFLLLWFFGPILLTWIVSQKFQPIFFDRYLLYTIPASMLVLTSLRRNISTPFIAIIVSLFLIIDFTYFTHPTKLPFRDLAQYVHESKRGDDYVVNWNGTAHHLWEAKYYGIDAPIYLTSKGALPFFVGTALMTPADTVYTLPKNAFRVGVITSDPIEEVKIPNYNIGEIHTFSDLKFIWLEK